MMHTFAAPQSMSMHAAVRGHGAQPGPFPRTPEPAVRPDGKHALLLDAALDDLPVLAVGAGPGMALARFGGSGDGLAQLRDWAATAADYAALHIVCHGTPGRLQLGTFTLDRAALAQAPVRDALRVIGRALGDGGAVLLYGCHVAEGAAGAAFVEALSLALDAPVAAARGLVGAAAAGGGWDLDYRSGAVAAGALAWPEYAHTLTVAQNTTTFSTISSNTQYASLPSGYQIPATLSVNDIAGSGWDVTAQASNNAKTFQIRGINGVNNGDGDNTSIRFEASDIDYVTFRSNEGFFFDLTSFSFRNYGVSNFTVQALDASGATTGAAVAYTTDATVAGDPFTPYGFAGNSDFVGIYGFKITLSSASDVPFFDNLVVANIGFAADTTPPAAPSAPDLRAIDDSGQSSNDNITNVDTPVFTGTAEAGSTVTLYDSNGSTVLGSAVASGGNWSITSSRLAQGVHTLTARAADAAGNVSAASSGLVVVVDTSAPAAVALSSTSAASTNAGARATLATLAASDSTAVTYALAGGDGSNDADNGRFSISGSSLAVGDAGLSAGTYRIYLSATDAAGNVSYLAQAFTVQDAPAVTSIVRAGGAAGGVAASATSVSYTVTFSQDVSGVDRGDFVLTTSGTANGAIAAVAGSGATYTVTVDGLRGDGTLRLDLNGSGTGIQNGGQVAIAGGYTSGASYTLDHTAPPAPSRPVMHPASDTGAYATDGVTRNTTPSFSGSAESGATVSLYADGVLLGSTTASGGSWSFATPAGAALSDGAHTITATARDPAGNVSAASNALAVVIDTAPPLGLALSTGSAATQAAGSGATLASLVASDNTSTAAQISYSLAEGNGSNDADNGRFTIAGNGLQVGASALAAGDYHLYVMATDLAGNVAYQALVFSVADAPSVTSVVRTGGAAGGVDHAATSIQYTVTFSEAVNGVDGADFTLTATGTAAGRIAGVSGGGTTYVVTVDGLRGDGTLRLDLNGGGTGIQNGAGVAIAGGYTAGANYTLDHTAPPAPSAPVLAPADDSGSSHIDNITRSTTPTFSGLAEDGAVVTLYDSDGVTVLGTGVATGGAWSIASTTLADGVHQLTVKAADAAGNTSPLSDALALTVDTVAAGPAAPALAAASDSGIAGDGVTNVDRPTITGTAEAFARVTLVGSDGSTVRGSGTANAAGAWSIVADLLADGSHAFRAIQTDRAGNTSLPGAGLALTIDTHAPAAPGVPALAAASDTGTVGDNKTSTARPVIGGSAEPDAVVTLYDSDGSTVLGSVKADGAGNWSITSTTLSTGAHTLTAKQTDAAGNQSLASTALALTIEAQPATPVQPPIQPPIQPPSNMVDGVAVQSQAVTLPGGGAGTRIDIPVIGAGRDETTGAAGMADIPLVVSGGATLLLAQLPLGFGMSAVGGASRPAGDSLEQLIAAIKAVTPAHAPGDQGHLVGNGTDFLGLLADSAPLLVQTITPTAVAAPTAALTLTGTSTEAQRTALVIDAAQLAAGSKLSLNGVDFAAIVGSADVRVGAGSKIISGDGAAQRIAVSVDNHGAVFSGGGSDTLLFGEQAAPAPSGAIAGASRALASTQGGTTLLHGGLDDDTAVFAGKLSDYTIERHESYLVVASKAEPG